MEDEMTLDGAIISASFDEALETVSKHCHSCLLINNQADFIVFFLPEKVMGDDRGTVLMSNGLDLKVHVC